MNEHTTARERQQLADALREIGGIDGVLIRVCPVCGSERRQSLELTIDSAWAFNSFGECSIMDSNGCCSGVKPKSHYRKVGATGVVYHEA